MKTHLKTNSQPHKTNPGNKSTTRFAIVAFLTLSSAIALPSCGAPPPAATGKRQLHPAAAENQIAASAPQSCTRTCKPPEAQPQKLLLMQKNPQKLQQLVPN